MKIDLKALPPAGRGAVVENTRGLQVVVRGGVIAGWVDDDGRAVTDDTRSILPDVAGAVGRLVAGLPDGTFGLTAAPGPDVIPAANPFALGATFNLTRQLELQRADPALARHMRETAAPEPNPFARGASFNLTQQIVMQRSDPEKAARLRAEAGG